MLINIVTTVILYFSCFFDSLRWSLVSLTEIYFYRFRHCFWMYNLITIFLIVCPCLILLCYLIYPVLLIQTDCVNGYSFILIGWQNTPIVFSHVSAYLVQCVLLQALKLFSYLRWFTNQKNQGYFQEHWYVSPSVSCGTKTIALITLDDFWSHISC